MNEIYTVDELSMGRDSQQLSDEINVRLLAGDIVIGETITSSLDLIIRDMQSEFVRSFICNSLDSQNPVPFMVREAIKGRVAFIALGLSCDLKKPF